jgi:HK97 family phage major capsid protein
MDLFELKKSLDDSNGKIEKTLTELRSELDGTKKNDVVQETKLTKIETDLAASLKASQDIALQMKALDDRLQEAETKAARPGGKPFANKGAEEYKTAFVDYLRNPMDPQVQQKMFDLSRKATDVRTSTGASGGFALPEEIATDIAQQVMDISPIRRIARVVQVGTPDYKELVDLNGFGTEWVGETATRNQTNTPNIGEVAPTFGSLVAKPEATVESLEDLFFNVESWLAMSAVEHFSQGEGLAFVSGDGTNKPTGFLAGPAPLSTADASRAFGTLQYIATGQAAALATAPFDSFKDMTMTLKAGYRANAQFVMNSLTMAALSKVKDSQGVYLLQRSVSEGNPYRLEGFNITIAEDMPIIAANAFPVAFGDFQRAYLIADRVGMQIIRDEVTKPGYVRYIMRRRLGGKLKDTNAMKLLKIAIS